MKITFKPGIRDIYYVYADNDLAGSIVDRGSLGLIFRPIMEDFTAEMLSEIGVYMDHLNSKKACSK